MEKLTYNRKGEKMLKIGDFSKLAKTSIKTLRYYDQVDLLKPIFTGDNGYRYYAVEQLNDLLMIVELRNLDISINDIKTFLQTENKNEILTQHLSELEQSLAKKEHQISLIKKYIDKVKKGEFMEKYVAKEIVVPKNIVYYRHGVIDSMQDMFKFVLDAGNECQQNNPNLECINYCYVTYTAKEYKERDVELEYVEAVKTFGKESENIKFRVEPEFKAISVIHKGPYQNLQRAYAFALNWVKEKDYEIVGAIREVYIDGCWNKQNPEEYLTEIQIPVKYKKL